MLRGDELVWLRVFIWRRFSAIVPRLGKPGPGLAQLLRICGGDVASEAESRRCRATRIRIDDIDALWRKRAELAKRIVDAAAPTIQELLLKVAMTASLLSEGEVGVGLTPQCLEECDRALAQEGDGEQCLKALEPELWALCQRVEEQTAALEARWDCVEQSEEAGGSNDASRRLLTRNGVGRAARVCLERRAI